MVGKICTVCKNSSYPNKRLSFFTYPCDPQRRYEWLKAVGRMDLLVKLENSRTRGNHRICEAHFENKYMKKSLDEGRKFLTRDAFPTLSLDNISNVVPMNKDNLRKPPVFYPFDGNEYVHETYLDDCSTPDLSEFCESVIKVSKSTQTVGNSDITKKQHVDDISEENPKRRKRDDTDKMLFMKLCQTFLPEGMLQLIKWQLKYGNTDNGNFNLFALNLYYSGSSYDILKNMLGFPSLHTLKKFLVPKTTKLNDDLLNVLKSKVCNMSNEDKISCISISSISLKANLYYNIKFDRIIGLHDVNGLQNIVPAKYAIMLMLQGIVVNWHQPIAYAFISEYENFPDISIWIDEVISSLIEIGLDIRAFVSDQGSEFLYMSESRSVTPDKTYFTLNNRNIFYVYDTLQLLKIVKTNLKSCDFHYNCDTADGVSANNFDTKLNNLVDMLNSSSLKSSSPYKQAFSGKQYQIDFMKHMLSLFQNMKVVRKIDGVDVTENMKFIKSFQITIKSVIQLFDDLNYNGLNYLLTTRLTHKCLNNFFIKLKTDTERDECTGRQFNGHFVRNFVSNILNRPSGLFRSSMKYSVQTSHFSQQSFDSSQAKDCLNRALIVSATDYRRELPEKNAFVYVCGYLYLKCLQRHSCDKLKAHIKRLQQIKDESDATFLCSISLINNYKILPPDSFTEFLMILERTYKDYLKPGVQITSIGQEFLKIIQNYEFDMPCPCFPIEFLKSLFIRVRIFYTVRENNKMFKSRKGIKTFKVFSL